MVPVLNFSAAPIDEEVANIKATIADNFNFIEFVNKLYWRCQNFKQTLDKIQ
jgi:hypothetical protein